MRIIIYPTIAGLTFTSTDIEVRRKAMNIVLNMTSSRNVEEVVLFFKKQLQRTQESDADKSPDYRQLLIQSIHITAIKFSEVAANVVHALMDFLGDSNNPSALDVVSFVREVVEKFPHLRAAITGKLINNLGEIKSGKVFRGVLWILGEYTEGAESIQDAMREVRKVLGEIPILASEQRLLDEASGGADDDEDKEKEKVVSTRPKVNADGTYATETAFTSSSATARLEAVKAAAKPPLRSTSSLRLLFCSLPDGPFTALILGGDFFTGSVLASSLTKLVLRFADVSKDSAAANILRAEVRLDL
jgi:coatomer subunit beta